MTAQLNLAEACWPVWKPTDNVNHVPRLWEGYREQRRQLQECKYGLPNVPESYGVHDSVQDILDEVDEEAPMELVFDRHDEALCRAWLSDAEFRESRRML